MKTLLVSLSIEYTYGRTLLRGILEEARRYGTLRIRLVRSASELRDLLISGQPIFGAVGMFWSSGDVRALRNRGIERVISFAQTEKPQADLHIILDDKAIGEMAASELSALGRKRVAVYSRESHLFSQMRVSGFAERSEAFGVSAEIMNDPDDLDAWLGDGGGGVFAVNDVDALSVLQRCSSRGIEVPATVSLLGADDDEVYVHLGSKLLSSLRLPFREMGAEAVRRILKSDFGSEAIFRMPPLGVVHRETTSTTGSYPPVLRGFLDRLLRERPLPSSVSDACKNWKISRRTLELMCKQHLGETPGELMRAERQRLASGLVAEGYSDMEIAYELGYAQARSFKRLMSMKSSSEKLP